MYHCLGIREQECTRVRYEGGETIFERRTREDKLYCAKCGSRHVIKSGSTIRRFRCVPIGARQITLVMTVQRLECKGHIYMTIVVNLEAGRIVYVGKGKGADALDGLWSKLKRAVCRQGAPVRCRTDVRLLPHRQVDVVCRRLGRQRETGQGATGEKRPLATAYYLNVTEVESRVSLLALPRCSNVTESKVLAKTPFL